MNKVLVQNQFFFLSQCLGLTIFLSQRCFLPALLIFALVSSTSFAQSNAEREEARILFSDGYNLMKANHLPEAQFKFESGLKKDPNNAMAHGYLGEVYYELAKSTTAVKYFQRSLDLDANSQVSDLARLRLEQLVRGNSAHAVSMDSMMTPLKSQIVGDQNGFEGASLSAGMTPEQCLNRYRAEFIQKESAKGAPMTLAQYLDKSKLSVEFRVLEDSNVRACTIKSILAEFKNNSRTETSLAKYCPESKSKDNLICWKEFIGKRNSNYALEAMTLIASGVDLAAQEINKPGRDRRAVVLSLLDFILTPYERLSHGNSLVFEKANSIRQEGERLRVEESEWLGYRKAKAEFQYVIEQKIYELKETIGKEPVGAKLSDKMLEEELSKIGARLQKLKAKVTY